VSPFDLTGKTALVTGVSRGIGLAVADALAAAGADIVGASTSLAPDSIASKRVIGRGRSFDAFQVDLADPAAVDTFIGQVSGRQIDILVNNAGIIRRAPAALHSDDDWAEVLQVNLTAQFKLTQAFGRQMIERGHGKIIFTASMLSFQGGVNVASYTAAKSAVAGLVKALANEWASKGVNVNAVAPGYIATDNTQALRDDAERNRAIVERIPVGRWGEPADVAGAYVFLSSSASDYVHGIVLPVDGGWLGR
jgi:2-deoxy-D-gluconate 3-dehydrogenase